MIRRDPIRGSARLGSISVAVLIALVAGVLYLTRLESPAPFLTPDELFSGLTAHAVATTGHDLNGRLMPMFFQLPPQYATRMWYQPTMIYAIAGVLKVVPLTEGTIRVPMAVFAIADIVLLFFVARLLFRSEYLGIAAAGLLAVTPGHFIATRAAMDHEAYLPFLLGWLLCVLLYLERNKPWLLFAAGVTLGIGLYTYIAAFLVMPACAAATGLLLRWRREPLKRQLVFAAGFLIPALICVPYVLTHTVIRDTLWRYERHEAPTAATSTIARALFSTDRLANAASLYPTFWNPQMLFVDGPRGRWPIGAFLLPVAGLFLASVLRAARRKDAVVLILFAAAVIAPVVATAGGEPGEVRRAAAMVPVLVLLAIAGLQYSQRAETPSAERWAVAVAWGAIILLAVIFKRQLPGGQALVRAATVPLAVTGLAAVVNLAPRQRAPLLWLAVCAGLVIGLLHRTYLIFINIEPIAIGALVALSAATLLTPMAQDTSRASLVSTTVLAVVVTYFLDTYLEYRDIHRIAPILSVVLMATAIAIGSAVMRARDSRFDQPLLALMVTAGIVGAQLLYFGIDVFTDYRLRFVQGTLLLALVVAVAALVRRHHIGVSQIATAGFIGIAAIQFTIFYADHVGRHGVRISGESEGSERIAFEAVIDHARGQSIPAVYLGWSGALTPLYWRFYAIKHHREDLLPRLIPAGEFNGEQIRRLPDGSVVVAKPSEQVDRQIDRMLAAGELAGRERLLAPDGTEAFWIMRVGAPVRRF